MTAAAQTDRPEIETDVVVVGGGAAGLYVALRAAERGARVTLVSRKPLAESASYWAQGGLAAALAPTTRRHATPRTRSTPAAASAARPRSMC